MPSSLKLFKKFPNNVFVETGSFEGRGINWALKSGFDIIKSVELSHEYYEKCVNKFKDNKNVFLFEGSSDDLLWSMIKDIDTPITFWLDAHYSGVTKVKGNEKSPIIKELNIIKRHPINTHTILIDDVRDMGTYKFDWVTIAQVKNKLKQINPDYHIWQHDGVVKNDIIVAQLLN